MTRGVIVFLFGGAVLVAAPNLPPVDTKCTRDSDCGVVLLYLDGPDQCCSGCGIDLTPENWSADYVSSYGGAYGEEEQVLRG